VIITKSISLKVNPPRDEYLSMMEEGKSLFNDYTNWIYNNGTYNKNKIHKECYQTFISKYPNIKVALQQSIRDVASSACKKEKLKGRPPTKKTLSISLTKNAFTLRGKQLTLIGVNKRYKEILHVPKYYNDIYENWKPKGSTLTYDKKKKQFWLHITYQAPREIKQFKNISKEKVLGIDRGIYNPIVTSDGSFIGCGKEIRRIKSNYQYLRQQLQKKGTRSAKKKLKTLSGKEKRFVLNQNHVLSKQVAKSDNHIFILEKLKHMKSNKYGKKFNRKMGNWSYFQFEQLLKYKAEALGKHIVYINPAYTSQECSTCGKILKSQRKGNKYECSCGYRGHSDLNAALNIRNRFLNSQDASKYLGVVITPPNEPELILGSNNHSYDSISFSMNSRM